MQHREGGQFPTPEIFISYKDFPLMLTEKGNNPEMFLADQQNVITITSPEKVSFHERFEVAKKMQSDRDKERVSRVRNARMTMNENPCRVGEIRQMIESRHRPSSSSSSFDSRGKSQNESDEELELSENIVDLRISGWEDHFVQQEPSAEELGNLWKDAKSALVSVDVIQHLPSEKGDISVINLEVVNLFRILNADQTSTLRNYGNCFLIDDITKYCGLRSAVYDLKFQGKTPLKVVAMIINSAEMEGGVDYFLALKVRPQPGYESEYEAALGKRHIALYSLLDSEDGVFRSGSKLYESEWIISQLPPSSLSVDTNRFAPIVSSSTLTSNTVSSENMFSKVLCPNECDDSKNYSSKDSLKVCTDDLGNLEDYNSSKKAATIYPSFEESSKSSEQSADGKKETLESMTFFLSPSSSNYFDGLEEHDENNYSRFQSLPGGKISDHVLNDSCVNDDVKDEIGSTPRNSLSSVITNRKDQLEYTESSNYSSVSSQGFVHIDLKTVTSIMSCDKFFLLVNEMDDCRYSTIITHNFKWLRSDSICHIEDNQVFEWIRGVHLKDWLYKWPSSKNGFGQKALRYFILKDNLLIYSQSKNLSSQLNDSLVSIDAEGSKSELNFSKGLVITADTTIEETTNLFQSCVKVYSKFSEKTLFLHFITMEQQQTWIKEISRAINLQRSKRDSISMSTKVYYYPRFTNDELISVEMKHLGTSILKVGLFKSMDHQRVVTYYLNLALDDMVQYNYLKISFTHPGIQPALNLVKVMNVASCFGADHSMLNLIFILSGTNETVYLGYIIDNKLQDLLLLEESETESSPSARIQEDEAPYLRLENHFHAVCITSAIKSIVILESLQIVMLLDSSNEMSFWKVEVHISKREETSYRFLRYELETNFLSCSAVFSSINKGETQLTQDENERIISCKLIHNFLLHNNAVNLEILHNNPNEVFNLLISTNYRMILFVLSFQYQDSNKYEGYEESNRSIGSFGVVGFVELNSMLNVLGGSRSNYYCVCDLSMVVSLSEKHSAHSKHTWQSPFRTPSQSPIFPTGNSIFTTSPSSNFNNASHINTLYRTNSLVIEQKWIEWNLFMEHSSPANPESDQRNHHPPPISPLCCVRRSERNKPYFQELLSKIHYL